MQGVGFSSTAQSASRVVRGKLGKAPNSHAFTADFKDIQLRFSQEVSSSSSKVDLRGLQKDTKELLEQERAGLQIRLSEQAEQSKAYEELLKAGRALQSQVTGLDVKNYVTVSGVDERYFSVTCQGEDIQQSFSLEIKQLAIRDSSQQIVTDRFVKDQRKDLGLQGGLSLAVEGITGQIDMESKSLRDVCAAINKEMSGHARASIITLKPATSQESEDGQYVLHIACVREGELLEIGNTAEGKVCESLNIMGSRKGAEELQAKIAVNGFEVQRSTNTIDDVLDGVRIQLRKVPEEPKSFPCATQLDLGGIKDALGSIVKNFEDFRTLCRENTQPGPDKMKPQEGAGLLYGNVAVQDVLKALKRDRVNHVELGIERSATGGQDSLIFHPDKIDALMRRGGEEAVMKPLNDFRTSLVSTLKHIVGGGSGLDALIDGGGVLEKGFKALQEKQQKEYEKHTAQLEEKEGAVAEFLSKAIASANNLLDQQNQTEMLSAALSGHLDRKKDR